VVDISGPWLHTILFEVPLLSIINECYYRNSGAQPDWDSGRRKLHDKILLAKSARRNGIPFVFSDFGTRRRFSKSWHEEILDILKSEIPDPCPGTSNLYFAWKKDLKPVGTMAHEWLMASQSLGPRLKDSQRFALEKWVQEYRGDLGIALSDVAGFDAFLTDFDLYFAKLFDGCRHDSGDPFSWGDRLINHYVSMNIDPRTKTAIFSDGLTFQKAIEIAEHFKGRISTSFGIGTNLTNDISADPIQIVIKMTRCQGSPVAKLSDSPGKQMCNDPHYLAYLSHIFKGEPK
jgi:nicotinate phosphoribosyltransferase